MSYLILTDNDINIRNQLIMEIKKISGDFGKDACKLEKDIGIKIQEFGLSYIISNLRLCGVIPERYGHDSSEEKLYSKYTDILLAASYSFIGLQSVVLSERADSADVESVSKEFNFGLVADAKAFRLSRTAKNQKDFKISALDNWKHGKRFAMLVCPVYQLPSMSSQIYFQAISRNVCIFSYSHLAVLTKFAEVAGLSESQNLLLNILLTVAELNPSKDSKQYWRAINGCMLNYSEVINEFWINEKKANLDAISIAKEECLTYFSAERERILSLSKEQAITELIKQGRFETKIQTVETFVDSDILSI
jgi:type II restriction enzyme